MSNGGSGLTPEQEAAYMVWAEEIERDDQEPRPTGSGVALEGYAAVAYSRAILDEISEGD